MEEDLQKRLTALNDDEAKKRKKLEQDVATHIKSTRSSVNSHAIGLLRVLGAENKAAAIAAIAVDKGLNIAEATMNTAVAVTKANTIDPTGILAARVQALGYAQVALIAATGLAQASQVGAGGASLGTAANPVSTQSSEPPQVASTQSEPRREVRVIQVNDDALLTGRQLKKIMAEAAEDGVEYEF